MDYKANWTYQNIDVTRLTVLDACPSYCNLISQLSVIPNDKIKFQLDLGYMSPLEGAIRPIFYIDAPNMADLFFNGKCGYRAQYYYNPENGLAANKYAFAKIEEKLMRIACDNSYAYTHPDKGIINMGESDLLSSLRMSSAKIWGDETENELQNIVTNNQDYTPQIIATRWIESAQAGIQKAAKGIKAPVITRLKFHGAFLREHKETVPIGKASRSEDVYFWGFS